MSISEERTCISACPAQGSASMWAEVRVHRRRDCCAAGRCVSGVGQIACTTAEVQCAHKTAGEVEVRCSWS